MDKCMENKNAAERLLAQLHPSKFGQYNLFPTILTLFINCSEFIFSGYYLPSDSHTKTVNLRPKCRSTQDAIRGAILLGIADWATYNCRMKQLRVVLLPLDGMLVHRRLPPPGWDACPSQVFPQQSVRLPQQFAGTRL